LLRYAANDHSQRRPLQVHGASRGKDSLVGIYYVGATHPYLATNLDGAPDDKPARMPQHPPT
jgi:hypothetical protein